MKSCDTLFKTITRLDAVVDSTPDKAGKAACATAWLYTQVDWFDDIIGLLEVVKDQAAVAASPSSSVASRYGGPVKARRRSAQPLWLQEAGASPPSSLHGGHPTVTSSLDRMPCA